MRTTLQLALFLAAGVLAAAEDRPKKVLLIAGAPSHPAGVHEYHADLRLLQQCLAAVPHLEVVVAENGWPADANAVTEADAIVIAADGGAKHPALSAEHRQELAIAMARGAGLGLLHYATESTPGAGSDDLIRWAGGAFEIERSVNPLWTAEFRELPSHPITRGVRPFALRDEWYFNLRFASAGVVTPLLAAAPTPEVFYRPDGPHEGNPLARAAVAHGAPQTLAWAFERPGGGRGFGLTGGHFHANWGHEDFRKLVLNAIVWLAGADVPPDGVASRVSGQELWTNLDVKPPTRNAVWRPLLDAELSQWEKFIGVPHGSAGLLGVPTDSDGMHGEPLGLGRDPLDVFSVEQVDGEPVLRVSGQIYGGLTTRDSFSNYHLRWQVRWGARKWPPRATQRRDSGLLYHATGPHGAFWNVWKRSIEFQIEETNIGDLYALAGASAMVPATLRGKYWAYDPRGARQKIVTGDGTPIFVARHRPGNFEKPTGEWNQLELIVVGRTAVHVVNGEVVLVAEDLGTLAGGGDDLPLTGGQIQVQSEGAEVEFRRIEIRPIGAIPTDYASQLPPAGR